PGVREREDPRRELASGKAGTVEGEGAVARRDVGHRRSERDPREDPADHVPRVPLDDEGGREREREDPDREDDRARQVELRGSGRSQLGKDHRDEHRAYRAADDDPRQATWPARRGHRSQTLAWLGRTVSPTTSSRSPRRA